MQIIERGKGILYRLLMRVLGGKLCSGTLKRFCDSRFSRHLIPAFVKIYAISEKEIEQPLTAFRSLSDFFIREIHPSRRPIDGDYSAIVSPVDGYVQSFGDIAEDQRFEVKGKSYSFEELTSLKAGSSNYGGGKFIILYLSPAQYHRFHSPLAGEGAQVAELGRRSMPVNRNGWKYGGRLLSFNHRVVFRIRRRSAGMMMIAVGALNVNSVIQSNSCPFWEKGQEVGYFSFGSTVVCLFEKGAAEWIEGLKEEAYVQVGERLANWQCPDSTEGGYGFDEKSTDCRR
ncbi:archaetidylserine decarboxylase [Saccharibacillus endophyticus]|uniref:phosphatidylserine decarboxylase n=1 Tax=Saccharibacillus endophyticus TaxID=2060666 RepID=A0ABQ1ZHY2_9BACL|nr:archaetidylserine decarboxylase [Saccharibacillus endophyticus]GGH67570.1 phosphatidylserine decarboxylase proenzyme [Saccharibacillus endophyticus]